MTDEPGIDPIFLMELTTAVVASYVSNNHVRAAELQDVIATVHASLASMGQALEEAPAPAKRVLPVSIKRSVTDEYIVSLEDGKRYQSLKRHLSSRGLTPADYRMKWDLPADYPMVAPGYSARRSELAKKLGLGNLRRKR